jgi:hypothetical protein
MKHIIEALGLCSSFSTAISTPAETSPLPKDSSGAPASGTFNYATIVGMLPTRAGIHGLILPLMCINVLGMLSVLLIIMSWLASTLAITSREPWTQVLFCHPVMIVSPVTLMPTSMACMVMKILRISSNHHPSQTLHPDFPYNSLLPPPQPQTNNTPPSPTSTMVASTRHPAHHRTTASCANAGKYASKHTHSGRHPSIKITHTDPSDDH